MDNAAAAAVLYPHCTLHIDDLGAPATSCFTTSYSDKPWWLRLCDAIDASLRLSVF
jgi:hypothetical protein